MHILVAAAGKIAQDQRVFRIVARQLDRLCHRVTGFQCGEDALGFAEQVKRREGFVIGDAHILGTAGVLQERVLGADAGIVETRRDRMRFGDLAVVIAENVRAVAVQHAGAACRKRGCVPARGQTLPRRFRADDSHSASFSASLSVCEPDLTGTTSAPSSFIRYTLIFWRSMSTAPMYTTHFMPKRAHTVAVATPCWPAPVSAMIRRLPIARATSACPTVLLILCAPVWFRSSRFSRICAPPTCCDRRLA